MGERPTNRTLSPDSCNILGAALKLTGFATPNLVLDGELGPEMKQSLRNASGTIRQRKRPTLIRGGLELERRDDDNGLCAANYLGMTLVGLTDIPAKFRQAIKLDGVHGELRPVIREALNFVATEMRTPEETMSSPSAALPGAKDFMGTEEGCPGIVPPL